MRLLLPLVVLAGGGLMFTACSKQADTAPGATSATATPTTETPPVTPTPAEEGISFRISDGTGRSGDATPPPGTPPSETASADRAPARLIHPIYPFYPLSLRMRGVEGRVLVRIGINTSGRIEKAEVVQSSEPRFNDLAMAALKLAQFSPAMDKGKPVAVQDIVQIPFESEFGSAGMPQGHPLGYFKLLNGIYYMHDQSGKWVPANLEKPVRLSIPTIIPQTAKPGDTLRADVRLVITDEGQVTSVTVSKASSPEFEAAIKEIAPFWQFIPRMKDGKALSGTTVEFPFEVKHSPSG